MGNLETPLNISVAVPVRLSLIWLCSCLIKGSYNWLPLKENKEEIEFLFLILSASCKLVQNEKLDFCYYRNKTAVGKLQTIQYMPLPTEQTEACPAGNELDCCSEGRMSCQIYLKWLKMYQLVGTLSTSLKNLFHLQSVFFMLSMIVAVTSGHEPHQGLTLYFC